jgi:2-polyprenyl-3-methyl-5-hydroxy-6-metoxy-1,4-benzoquinol methylase
VSQNAITDEQYWDDRWEQWNKISHVARWDKMWGPSGSFLRLMKHYAGNLENLNILELGGAGSYHGLALAQWGHSTVTLLDYSAVGLAKTKEVYEKNNCSVTTIQADFFNWKPKGEKYDVVVHWGVLEHFQDPSTVLSLCADLIKPGGKIIFTMPNMEAWGSTLWRKWSPEDWERHIYHSDKDIQEACKQTGLELQEIFYWGAPLIQITTWEKRGILQTFVRIKQRAFSLLGKLIPIYHRGTKRISMHRGFVLK